MSSSQTISGVATSGRPRKPETDRAILEAALQLFGETGYEGMTIEAVAAKAGVGKATIYRRWDSKDDLIIGGISRMMTRIEAPDTGDIRTDLSAMMNGALRLMNSSTAGLVFPRMCAELAGRTALGLRYKEAVIDPRREIVRAMITRAIKRGQLRGDINIKLMADMTIAPFVMRKILDQLEGTDETTVADLISVLLEGWLPRG